jgi:glycosyltransferase involved in cell wall biosynthesis
MHVMFIHPNFPAQFGHIAAHLAQELGWTATCVTSVDTSHLQGKLPPNFRVVSYKLLKKKDEPLPPVFYNPDRLSVLFEHLESLYAGLRGVNWLQPDLVVGHMSYGTLLYLRNLYRCPFVGYYELLPPPFWGDELTLRKEFPVPESVRLFNATYHALTYLHLHAVDGAYTPTRYQLGTAPAELRHKIRVLFDGVDAELFRRRPVPRPAEFRGAKIGPDTRVVTFVSRGLESARGFDIFLRVAKRIYQQFDDVVFLVAGKERTNYGHEGHYIGRQSFKQYALAQDTYDLSKFHFLDLIPTEQLPLLYSLSDLHVYLTVPYVLSWSVVQAMANECTILGSATPPVQEAIDDGVHGLLADFYDVDGLSERAVAVLRDPDKYRHLGAAARRRVLERYEKKKCINELVEYFRTFVKSNDQ